MHRSHIPVLLKEVIDFLKVKKGGKYIDCTFGLGGHSKEILKKGGKVLGLDSDKACLDKTQLMPNLILENVNFSDLERVAKRHNFAQVDGILYDLGLSSWQLEHSGRGFSFQRNEPLDMRRDPTLNVTAANLINSLSKNELYRLFKEFGEEQRARQFAKAVVGARSARAIETTSDLIDVLELKKRPGQRIHPATRIFQALRIAVNSELLSLKDSLPQAQNLLSGGGRLVVISYHSLEDRVVREFSARVRGLKVLTKKPITPSPEEIKINPRSRSAMLRVFEKS